MQTVGHLEPLRRRARPLLRRDREPALDPRRAADPAGRRPSLATSTRSASARSRCSTAWTSSRPTTRCSRDGFVYEMILAHEHQHNETMLQLLQMVERLRARRATARRAGEPVDDGPEMVLVEGGEVEIGAAAHGFAYDNERPRHAVELEPFWIDRTPVTNRCVRRVRDGRRRRAADVLGAGRRGRLGANGDGPPDAARSRRARSSTSRGTRRTRSRAGPASGCRPSSSGRRPSAGADPERANLDHLAFDCSRRRAPTQTPPPTAAPSRCWATSGSGLSSDFTAYPGFRAFPYREYSEVFFGDTYKVLRGGAWATRRNVIRPSFRNWDLPERRQIFAGFRCAKDA